MRLVQAEGATSFGLRRRRMKLRPHSTNLRVVRDRPYALHTAHTFDRWMSFDALDPTCLDLSNWTLPLLNTLIILKIINGSTTRLLSWSSKTALNYTDILWTYHYRIVFSTPIKPHTICNCRYALGYHQARLSTKLLHNFINLLSKLAFG